MQPNITSDNSFTDNKVPNQGYSNTTHDVTAVDPYRLAEQMRVMPRQLSTGSQRGEMTIQGKLIVTDPNSNQRILVGNHDNEFGIFGATISGNDEENLTISWKVIGATRYVYKNSENFLQDGVLPDGVGGFIIVKDGYEVEDVYS